MIADMNFNERSLMFARLAELVYSDDVKEVKKEAKKLGFTTVEFYNNGGAQAYRLQNKTDMVIACRGTQPSEFNDIKADLRAAPVIAETVGRVHVGFKTEVDELWPMIKEDLLDKNNASKMVWFCGHSLGAGMATIMASRCEDDDRMPNIEELYTYGSPRVGWRKYVKSLSCKHHRWVNNNDVVTQVPLAIMGYTHHGQEHYMNAYGDVRKLTGWQRVKDRWRGMWIGIKTGSIDNFSDHSMTNYIANLEKLK
jgi:triacylglycerol lipase|tara:strand:- start:1535 stop:2293 length:759 start_codon:yes stop_codon:yes gene_type:complete